MTDVLLELPASMPMPKRASISINAGSTGAAALITVGGGVTTAASANAIALLDIAEKNASAVIAREATNCRCARVEPK